MLRHKWTEEEDSFLIRLIKEYGCENASAGRASWDFIVSSMESAGFHLTRKQVLDRWTFQLHPSISKQTITISEQKLLFDEQAKWGNKWKAMAEHQVLPHRTENWLKNQFFLILRKALRKAEKIIGETAPTKSISELRPSILLRFLERHVNVPGAQGGEGFCLGKEFSVREFLRGCAFMPQEELQELGRWGLAQATRAVFDVLDRERKIAGKAKEEDKKLEKISDTLPGEPRVEFDRLGQAIELGELLARVPEELLRDKGIEEVRRDLEILLGATVGRFINPSAEISTEIERRSVVTPVDSERPIAQDSRIDRGFERLCPDFAIVGTGIVSGLSEGVRPEINKFSASLLSALSEGVKASEPELRSENTNSLRNTESYFCGSKSGSSFFRSGLNSGFE